MPLILARKTMACSCHVARSARARRMLMGDICSRQVWRRKAAGVMRGTRASNPEEGAPCTRGGVTLHDGRELRPRQSFHGESEMRSRVWRHTPAFILRVIVKRAVSFGSPYVASWDHCMPCVPHMQCVSHMACSCLVRRESFHKISRCFRLNTASVEYGSGLHKVHFAASPSRCKSSATRCLRQTCCLWVLAQTRKKYNFKLASDS